MLLERSEVARGGGWEEGGGGASSSRPPTIFHESFVRKPQSYRKSIVAYSSITDSIYR